MTTAMVSIERTPGRAVVALAGSVIVGGIEAVRRELAKVGGPGEVIVDLSAVETLDTAGAWALVDLQRRLTADGVQARIEGMAEGQAALIATVEKSLPAEEPPVPARGGLTGGLTGWLAAVGEGTAGGFATFLELLSLFGEVIARVAGLVIRPWRLRLTSLIFHMEEVGLNAVPIVSLMAFLIGVVLAFQGAAQLRQFGAEIFVVDLIAISVLREFGDPADRDHRGGPLGLRLHRRRSAR